eukprot:10264490-Alexandrium_andersonii.AAC.1
MAWSLEAAAMGEWPDERWEGEWQASDSHRADRAGTPLPFVGAVVCIKGDWAEFAHTLGFTGWGSKTDPCFMCHASQDDMYEFGDARPGALPWPLKRAEWYNTACASCERPVQIRSEAEH